MLFKIISKLTKGQPFSVDECKALGKLLAGPEHPEHPHLRTPDGSLGPTYPLGSSKAQGICGLFDGLTFSTGHFPLTVLKPFDIYELVGAIFHNPEDVLGANVNVDVAVQVIPRCSTGYGNVSVGDFSGDTQNSFPKKNDFLRVEIHKHTEDSTFAFNIDYGGTGRFSNFLPGDMVSMLNVASGSPLGNPTQSEVFAVVAFPITGIRPKTDEELDYLPGVMRRKHVFISESASAPVDTKGTTKRTFDAHRSIKVTFVFPLALAPEELLPDPAVLSLAIAGLGSFNFTSAPPNFSPPTHFVYPDDFRSAPGGVSSPAQIPLAQYQLVGCDTDLGHYIQTQGRPPEDVCSRLSVFLSSDNPRDRFLFLGRFGVLYPSAFNFLLERQLYQDILNCIHYYLRISESSPDSDRFMIDRFFLQLKHFFDIIPRECLEAARPSLDVSGLTSDVRAVLKEKGIPPSLFFMDSYDDSHLNVGSRVESSDFKGSLVDAVRLAHQGHPHVLFDCFPNYGSRVASSMSDKLGSAEKAYLLYPERLDAIVKVYGLSPLECIDWLTPKLQDRQCDALLLSRVIESKVMGLDFILAKLPKSRYVGLCAQLLKLYLDRQPACHRSVIEGTLKAILRVAGQRDFSKADFFDALLINGSFEVVGDFPQLFTYSSTGYDGKTVFQLAWDCISGAKPYVGGNEKVVAVMRAIREYDPDMFCRLRGVGFRQIWPDHVLEGR